MNKGKKLWEYEICSKVDIKHDVIENMKIKGKYLEDLAILFDLVGTQPHPSLKVPSGKEHLEPSIISFNHICIDMNTARILMTLLNSCKCSTLKFNFNNFEVSVLEYIINSLLNKNNNILVLNFEWNYRLRLEKEKEIISWEPEIRNESYSNYFIKAQNLISKLGLSTKIESLCLRGNYLGDDAFISLIENLKSNNVLKVLNVYFNNITSKGFNTFLTFLENNKKLEEVNFGKNNLTDNDLVDLKKVVGRFLMSPEETEAHQKKIKDRELIIEKNKKLRLQRKPEEPLPVIEDIALIGDNYYVVKNTKLRNINLMQNKFTNECYPYLLDILNVTESLFITIDNRLFNKEQVNSLTYPSSAGYFSRIYLTK